VAAAESRGSDQEERVEQLTHNVPGLWADHHVLKVRDALVDLEGLEQVEASAKDRTLTLLIDPARLDAARVADHLAAAGYPPGEPEAAHDTPRAKPEWAGAGVRSTRTNPVDLTMSGDHRKY
jgi:copper chaperone CopZ